VAGTLRDVARQVVAISQAGLKSRNILDSSGNDESHFLGLLHRAVDSGLSPADELLEHYHRDWKGDIDRIFCERAYSDPCRLALETS